MGRWLLAKEGREEEQGVDGDRRRRVMDLGREVRCRKVMEGIPQTIITLDLAQESKEKVDHNTKSNEWQEPNQFKEETPEP